MEKIKAFQERLSGLIDGYYSHAEDAITKRKNITNLLSEFSIDLHAHLEKVKNDRTKIFYPKSSHAYTDIKQAGMEEIKAAYVFLDSPRNTDNIKNQIEICKNLGQIDFLSTIFQKLSEQLPKSKTEWELLKVTDRNNFDFSSFIEMEYKKFTSKNGIDFLDNKIKHINEIERKANDFKTTINK